MIRKFLLLIPLVLTVARAQEKEPPREWLDPDTGHRVIRLSDEPGSASLYFHQNAYTASGDKLVFTTRNGLSVYNFKTHKVEPLVEGRVSAVVVGKKTRQVFYCKGDTVYATDLDTRVTREILKGDTVTVTNLETRSPQKIKLSELRAGSGLAVNADETLLAGSYTEGGGRPSVPPPASATPGRTPDSYPGKGAMMERRLAARLPMALYTISVKTGEVKTFHHATDWLNHVQFSPTDPNLIMFCHEGPWHKVDRIWSIRSDGTGLRKIHTRTINMEIAGHEFFSADGQMIWYDLQTPRSQDFWLAGYNLSTSDRIWYHLERSEWSVHFNASPDGTLFAGDGGGPSSVAAPGNGQWIYLFRPEMVPDRAGAVLPNSKDLIKPGFLKAEKLVNLAKHNYSLEPNVTFAPDGKWIVFRSNMLGPTHVFAVEVQKAK